MHARKLIRSSSPSSTACSSTQAEVAAASKGILRVEGETLVARVVGGEVREHETFVEAADEESVEADFQAAGRVLTVDLAASTLPTSRAGTRTTMACSRPTSRSPPWRRSKACQTNSTGKPTRLGKKWFGKYRVAIKGLTDERRAVYDEIKGMSPEPQVIDLKRPASAPRRPRTPTATS